MPAVLKTTAVECVATDPHAISLYLFLALSQTCCLVRSTHHCLHQASRAARTASISVPAVCP